MEESRCLVIGCSDGEHFEVLNYQSNSVNLIERTYSCRWQQVYDPPCKHACATIILTDTNIHWFVDTYHTIDFFNRFMLIQKFPIPDHDKPPISNFDHLSQRESSPIQDAGESSHRRSKCGNCIVVIVTQWATIGLLAMK